MPPVSQGDSNFFKRWLEPKRSSASSTHKKVNHVQPGQSCDGAAPEQPIPNRPAVASSNGLPRVSGSVIPAASPSPAIHQISHLAGDTVATPPSATSLSNAHSRSRSAFGSNADSASSTSLSSPPESSELLEGSCNRQQADTAATNDASSPLTSPVVVLPPHSVPPASATVSFSSVSTLTSLPLSSQSYSRRIVKNGISAVTNSDSGSDESSDESLPDVSAFLPSKRRKLSPPDDAPQSSILTRATRSVPDVTRRNPTRAHQIDFNPSPPRLSYKYSLAKLVRQSTSWVNAEARIADLESAVHDTELAEDHSPPEHLGADVLAASASNDADEQRRMLHALERTEALKRDFSFHFFRNDKPLFDNAPFPAHVLPHEPWSRIYRSTSSREHACLTGFARELAAIYPLPMAITNWMAHQLQHEPNVQLCNAYVDIIEASRPHLTSLSDSISMFSSFYEICSATEDCPIDMQTDHLPPGVKHVTQLVRCCAPITDCVREDTAPQMTCCAILDFAFLNVDSTVRKDVELSLHVMHCIEEMLEGISEVAYKMLLPEAINIFISATHLPALVRYKAVTAFPSGTWRAAELRRRLALQCFVRLGPALGCDEQEKDWTRAILERMKTGTEFAISESTDYHLLSSLISVLDAAISNGFDNTRNNAASTAVTADPPSTPNAQSPFQSSPSTADSQHDQDIDAVTQQLQRLASRIVNVGTSHLKRTEAKSSIEMLIARLQGCARSRPAQKRGIFDGAPGSSGVAGMFRPRRSLFGGADDASDGSDGLDDAVGCGGASVPLVVLSQPR